MDKKIGVILLIIGVILIGTIFSVKQHNDKIIEQFVIEKGSCFLDEGTCLHKQTLTGYIIGWIIAAIILSLGLYILFFEKSQKEIVSALGKQKQIKVDEEKFEILLKGLSGEEKKVIKAVKEQDGITQQTLRLRTDLHKSKLSIVLDGLEKKDLISRKPAGKTKKVFIKTAL